MFVLVHFLLSSNALSITFLFSRYFMLNSEEKIPKKFSADILFFILSPNISYFIVIPKSQEVRTSSLSFSLTQRLMAKGVKPVKKTHYGKFFHSHKTLWTEQHDKYQYYRIYQKAVVLQETQEFLQIGKDVSRKNRAGHGTHAAQHDINKKVDRSEELRYIRSDKADNQSVDTAAYAGDKSGNDKAEHLVAENINPVCVSRNFIFPARLDRPTVC